MMNDTSGIQKYSQDILPKQIGESVIVDNIGLIALNPNEYKVEGLTASNIYKITKIN